MDGGARGTPWVWLRVGLVAFVVAWILGPDVLRDSIPVLVVFAVALGLELHFLVGALRNAPVPPPDRSPQQVDRDRYGFPPAAESEVEGDDEHLWEAFVVEEDEEGHDLLDEPAPRARPLRRFGLGLALIVALGAVVVLVDRSTGWGSLPGERRAAAVERFSAEASRIAGKPVDVRCDEARDYVGAVQHADGVAIVGGELAILTPEICHALYELAVEGSVRGSRTGRAVAVLAHEAWHLRGERDEGTTECYALQSGVALGERLGLAEGEARRLMRQQLTENELRGLETLEYRVGPECRNGGALDLDPASGDFP